MKKIYALLAGVMVASGISAATLEKAPRLSMENATVVGRLEGNALKAVADQTKKVLSRADEAEVPEVVADYLLCYSNYSSQNKTTTTRMAAHNNLVPTENEGEYKFETFIFTDVSMKANLVYDPEFWSDSEGNPVGEWILSIPVGEDSEPLFYEDMSDFASYGFTDNEPVYFYLAGIGSDKKIGYYTNETYDFVVRDGWLMSPYKDGIGMAMATRFIPNVGNVTYGSAYVDFFAAVPNASGTATEQVADEEGNTETDEIEFPMYTETFENENGSFLYVRGLCGWPGEVIFHLNQEEEYAYANDMVLTVFQDYDLYMSQDGESTEVLMNVTPESTGKTVLSTDVIGLLEKSSESILALYNNVVVTLDYNIWTGELDGIQNAEIEEANAPAVYFNLQGMKVSNPVEGQVYIVKQGNKVSKQVIR